MVEPPKKGRCLDACIQLDVAAHDCKFSARSIDVLRELLMSV